ncbi:DUF1491 family protein [Rhodoligotrophos defluvii]|uniref:DUF1491 family protein n=1 Tax=Rhodoligotrophos defluvii TaxID=2561934 RepID=UPI0010C966C9|nr:DUF1491 family protein [Rhodoligotrophos defluvii]
MQPDEFSPPPRIRSALWVSAQIRRCDALAVPAVISRRGDPDAGSILIKVYRGRADCTVFTPASTMAGERGWMRATGPEPVDEATADAYIQRQSQRDSDLWVLEIEDPRGLYQLEDVIE